MLAAQPVECIRPGELPKAQFIWARAAAGAPVKPCGGRPPARARFFQHLSAFRIVPVPAAAELQERSRGGGARQETPQLPWIRSRHSWSQWIRSRHSWSLHPRIWLTIAISISMQTVLRTIVTTDSRYNSSKSRADEPMLITANGNTLIHQTQRLMFPAEVDTTQSYRFASDISRRAGHSLVVIVRRLELAGDCIAALGEDNIRVSPDGMVTLHGVDILRGLGTLDPVAFQATLRANYAAVGDIIDSLYGQPADVPDDISNLTDMMRHNFDDRAMFAIHGALVSQSKYAEVYKVVQDFVKDCKGATHYQQILPPLVQHTQNWQQSAQQNNLLLETLNYPRSDYNVPGDVANQQKINKAQRKTLKKIGIAPNKNAATLTPQEMAMIECNHLLFFIRNHSAHRMEPYLAHVAASNPEYCAEESELIVRVRWGVLLPALQRSIFDINPDWLLHLNLEKYF